MWKSARTNASSIKAAKNSMSTPTFLPWVGREYGVNPIHGRRILILGESHYNRGGKYSAHSEFTRNCIIEQIKGERRGRFWTNVAIALMGAKPKQEDKANFWNRVCFYNYVQKFAGDGPRIRPTDTMWKTSSEAFHFVLREVKPELMVVLGYSLWKNIPKNIGRQGMNKVAGRDTWWYPISNSSDCLAVNLIHPSSGKFRAKISYGDLQLALQALDVNIPVTGA